MHVLLSVYFTTSPGLFESAGSGEKDLGEVSFETAQEEAREWVRRNRMSNPEHPHMRYKVEITGQGRLLWTHDETRGDALLEPTADTAPSCSVS